MYSIRKHTSLVRYIYIYMKERIDYWNTRERRDLEENVILDIPDCLARRQVSGGKTFAMTDTWISNRFITRGYIFHFLIHSRNIMEYKREVKNYPGIMEGRRALQQYMYLIPSSEWNTSIGFLFFLIRFYKTIWRNRDSPGRCD